MNYLVVALVILMAICFWGSREGFVDFGFSGYHKPVGDLNFSDELQAVDTSNYKRDSTVIPLEKLNAIANVVTEYLKNKTGKCMQPIETIYINKYSGESGDMYDTRFMFYDPKHFFVAEILAKVLQNKKSDQYMISSVRTQVPSVDQSGPLPYGGGATSQFVEYPEILNSINPSNNALQAVSKALEENKPPQ